MAKILVFASSDLVSDQRVHRTSQTLFQMGHKVISIGRRLGSTPPKVERQYSVKHFRMMFKKGFLFYFFFNVRTFFYILFHEFDLVCSNDLDTLLACKSGCALRRKPLVYDSHELFTEVPELIDRPFVQGIWKTIERICVRGLKYTSTVSESVALEYKKRYGVDMVVIRNVPFRNENFGHKSTRPTIIYQGVLNKGRGIELAIEMMQYLPCYYLVIAGSGDIELELRKKVIDLDLLDRIEFKGRIPYEKLHELTSKAWLGISLEEDLGLNYRYALPNKLFDYIQAQIAVLVSDLPEMSKLVIEHGVGLVAITRDPKELAKLVQEFFEDKGRREVTYNNLSIAYNKLVWENEKSKFIDLYQKALSV